MGKCPGPDTLSTVLIGATKSILQNMSCSTFAFDRLVPALSAAGVFHDDEQTTNTDDYLRWKQRVFKRISRILSGEQAMPTDWFIPWMSVLPSKLKESCLNRTAAALGIYPIKLPTFDTAECGARAGIDVLSHEFADVISASRPAMDGAYSADDNHGDLQRLQNELYDLHNRVLAEIVAIAASTGVTPAKFGEAL